jgi:hypothetical protein
MKLSYAIFVFALFIHGVANAEDRTVIKIPSDVKDLFLEEMRTHLDNLNEITLALSAGDFKGAAFVAENKMSFGHSARDVLAGKGMPKEEIDAYVKKMQSEHQKGSGMDMGMNMGMGRFMPAEVRELGQTFHTASQNLAKVANSVGEVPSVSDYQRVFTALSEVVDVCSACHSSFHIE